MEKKWSTLIEGSSCCLRNFVLGDEKEMVEVANNKNIWRNLRNTFPHPYTIQDAESWIQSSVQSARNNTMAICLTDNLEKVIGGIGIHPGTDVSYKTAELGYWLGEPYWGKGIGTEAVKLITEYAFKNFDLIRLEATVFAWNPASARVLEKNGFEFEGRKKNEYFKDGQIVDGLMYGKIKT